jgi:hypothetical protein
VATRFPWDPSPRPTASRNAAQCHRNRPNRCRWRQPTRLLQTCLWTASLWMIALVAAPVRDIAGIEAAVGALATEGRGGAIVLPGPFVAILQQEIFAAANRFDVPIIYSFRHYVENEGLLSYGVDESGLYRDAASYIDRILKGAHPGDLPVQAPTKFELVLNTRSAKAIGIEIPASIFPARGCGHRIAGHASGRSMAVMRIRGCGYALSLPVASWKANPAILDDIPPRSRGGSCRLGLLACPEAGVDRVAKPSSLGPLYGRFISEHSDSNR